MEYRLRIYTLREGTAAEFAALWERDLVPLRRDSGFEVLGAWTVCDQDQFVWIVGWPGPGDYDSAERAYHASPERQSLSWATSDYVVSYDIRPIEPLAEWRR